MKILIADDHAMMRDGLRAILAGQAGMCFVGEASDGHDAIAQAVALAPDVVVMDISMPRAQRHRGHAQDASGAAGDPRDRPVDEGAARSATSSGSTPSRS